MKTWQMKGKNAKKSTVENSKIFEAILKGYGLLVPENLGHPDVLQTFNFHILSSKWHFGTNIPPQSGQKRNTAKMTKNGAKRPKNPKISIWWIYMIKIIGNYAWKNFWTFSGFFDHFWSIFIFSLKTHDFSKKIFGNPKMHLVGPRNPLGWASHVVLGQNQWLRPKNGIWKKCTQNIRKCSDMVS